MARQWKHCLQDSFSNYNTALLRLRVSCLFLFTVITLTNVFFFFSFSVKCVVGGCNATFASQGGLARHVPTHFSSQNSSKLSSQTKVKEESPSKAGMNKRKKLKYKRRRSLRKCRYTFTSCSFLFLKRTNSSLFFSHQHGRMTFLMLRLWMQSVIAPSASI